MCSRECQQRDTGLKGDYIHRDLQFRALRHLVTDIMWAVAPLGPAIKNLGRDSIAAYVQAYLSQTARGVWRLFGVYRDRRKRKDNINLMAAKTSSSDVDDGYQNTLTRVTDRFDCRLE